MARATGFQIYICRPGASGMPAWTLKAPDAELFDEQGKSIGKHFGGPTWQLSIPGAGLPARSVFACWDRQARDLLRCSKRQFDPNFT